MIVHPFFSHTSRFARRSFIIVLLALLSISASTLTAAPKKKAKAPVPEHPVELGAPFNDYAVLQRGQAVPVWGWAKAGETVTVQFAGQKKSAKAGKDGKWMIKLDSLKASAEPRDLVISESGGDKRTLKEVLVGEVWMASGQSNMQWLAGKSAAKQIVDKLDAAAEANGGKKAPIREFSVSNYYAHLHPIEHARGTWNNGNYSNYSAIAFSFAHKLYEELGVPIGILNCSFSQTSIEAWTPREGYLNSQSDYNKKIYQKTLETDPSTPEHKKAWAAFYEKINQTVDQNQKLADAGESNFIGLPTNDTPGNMRGNRDATWLFNARLNPVIPYAINGAIWNQGYANMGGGLTYYNNLHAMIRGWRMLWERPELPVYFHQFYSPGNDAKSVNGKPSIGSTAEMRLGTWLARDIPNTGMASQIDIQGAIHYGNKVVPGQRLALHALKNQYGKDIVADGPMFKGYEVKGDKLIIEFENADGGLVVAETDSNRDARKEGATGFADPKVIPNGADKVGLFSVAGEDRVWHSAKVEIQGGKAVVSSPKVKSPRGVSYGTDGIGFQPNLYNKALLPTTPFIVYDNKLVTSESWPDEALKIAGEEIDPSSVGLVYEYRKFPILGPQFRDNGVLQAGVPITIWGAANRQYLPHVAGEKVIHFSFNGIEKTIPVVDGVEQWQVTVPAMKASAEPKTIKVKLTIDGELAHERVAENIVVGDVWYVAGLGKESLSTKVDSGPVDSAVRVMKRQAKGAMSSNPRPYSVCVSTTPKNRFASYWGVPEGDGFAAQLAAAIHKKTGKPVGIIYMDGGSLELKHWMDVPSLANAPSLLDDYKDIAAVTPGTPYYKKNAQRYLGAWKAYWSDYIPEMIATKSVPDQAPWGSYPAFAGTVETKAMQACNVMVTPFNRTQVKGIVFMTEPSMVANADGKHFGSELSALANGLKKTFGKSESSHFIYTVPAKSLVSEITRPDGIGGPSAAHEFSAWPKQDKKGNATPDKDGAHCMGLVEAVIKTAY